MRLRTLLVLSLLVGWAVPAAAQSLADVARKEEARRSKVKHASRVLTNKDLKPSNPVTPPPPPPATPDAKAAPEGDAAPAAAPDAEVDEEAKREQDEQAWRQRMADARLALERSQMYADALQSKINALYADFTARDDPAQRSQIELERKRAIAEQERVREEIESQKKAIADIEEEARRAGVPPGWLR